MPAPYRDLGPCFVRWDPTGANIDLNPTLGGVKWRDTLLFADVLEDAQGETPVDAVTKGRTVEVEVPMTRFSLHQLSEVIEGSVIVGTRLTVSNAVGNAMYAHAAEIIVKPTEDNVASGTTTEWMHFFRCFPVIDQEIVYDNSEQRVAKVLFKVFPSQDTTEGLGKMYRYGPAA